jgi:hypothetical protein
MGSESSNSWNMLSGHRSPWANMWPERGLPARSPEFVGDEEPRRKARTMSMHEEMLDM